MMLLSGYSYPISLITICQFNDLVALCRRKENDGQTYPLFDYEQLLFNTLQPNKHIWIKKATGLGVRVYALRTAVENGEGALDKSKSNNHDTLDALRLSLCYLRSINSN
jgi:hypothetical protein